VVPFGLNCIDALLNTVEPTNASLDTAMSGDYCRLDEDELANGPTALACFAELSVVAFDGFGTPKTTSGLRYTQTIRSDGFTWTLVRKHGTTLVSTLRAGVRRCLTASPFPLMVLLMSLDDTFARPNTLLSVTDALKRFFSMLCKRLRTCADPT
jgi:hypothetical protein